jgi:polyvinyl alcohol dehydrogenase (cytochrome)
MADPAGGPAWNGWGADFTNARFQTAQAAGLDAASAERLKLKWAFGFPGGTSAFGQPSIVSGRVFVGTDTGFVYALDAQTGAPLWTSHVEENYTGRVTAAPALYEGRL